MMIDIKEYLLGKSKPNANMIEATNETLFNIVHDEIKWLGADADLNHIDVSKVTDMCYSGPNEPERIDGLFTGTGFCGDVSRWDVSNVENMSLVFYECDKFNGNLGNWDVSKVVYASSMFNGCTEFEGTGLEKWNVANLKDACGMFLECRNFNADITKWDTKSLVKCTRMFDTCTSLRRDLSKWNAENVEYYSCMFDNLEYYYDGKKRPRFKI